MKTPAKDYISALKSGSYGTRTPLTSSSIHPQTSTLTIYKLADISLFAQNELMSDLQQQNVRLMQRILNFVQQRQKLKQHCSNGLKQLGQQQFEKVQQQLIAMSRILSGIDDVLQQPNQQTLKYKLEVQKYQRLIQQLKSIIASHDILPFTKDKVLNEQIIYPQLFRQDLDDINERIGNIEGEIISAIKKQITKITKLFKTNKQITDIDTDGHFSFELLELIQAIKNLMKMKTKSLSEPAQSVNTSMEKIIKQKSKQKPSSFEKSQIGTEQYLYLYNVILAQAEGLQKFLEYQESNSDSKT